MSKDIKFDEPQEREVEVDAYEVSYDEKNKQPLLKKTKQKYKETVSYHYAPVTYETCVKGKHNYEIKDRKKYIARCSKCIKGWNLSPVKHKLLDGHIYDRIDNHLID